MEAQKNYNSALEQEELVNNPNKNIAFQDIVNNIDEKDYLKIKASKIAQDIQNVINDGQKFIIINSYQHENYFDGILGKIDEDMNKIRLMDDDNVANAEMDKRQKEYDFDQKLKEEIKNLKTSEEDKNLIERMKQLVYFKRLPTDEEMLAEEKIVMEAWSRGIVSTATFIGSPFKRIESKIEEKYMKENYNPIEETIKENKEIIVKKCRWYGEYAYLNKN